MPKTQVNVRLDEGAVRILRSAASGFASQAEILERLLTQHREGWADALAALLDAGWSLAEMRCACDALGGTMLGEARPASWLAVELVDVARIVGLPADVDPDAWTERCERIRREEGLARALRTLARAYWVGDAALAARLESPTPQG